MEPWNGSGIEVHDATDAEDVMAKANLNWEVEGRLLLTPRFDSDGFDNLMAVPTHKAIVRKDSGQIMGVVGSKWNILQNHEVFGFVDELAQMGLVKYRTAGSFKQGKIVWVQAEYQESEIVTGDVHKKNLLLTNAFDGTFSVRIGWTDIRMSCSNQIVRAGRDAQKNGVAIKHTASMHDKIDVARKVLVEAESQGRQFDMFQKALTRLNMTSRMWNDFTNELFPNPENGSPTRATKARDRITFLGEYGRGQESPGVRGTAYAALNGLSEYANYERSSRGKSEADKQAGRYQAVLYGASNKLINKGISILDGFLVNSGIQVD